MSRSSSPETLSGCYWCDDENVHPYDAYHKNGECVTRGLIYDDAVVCYSCGEERGPGWTAWATRVSHPAGFTCASCGDVLEFD